MNAVFWVFLPQLTGSFIVAVCLGLTLGLIFHRAMTEDD